MVNLHRMLSLLTNRVHSNMHIGLGGMVTYADNIKIHNVILKEMPEPVVFMICLDVKMFYQPKDTFL